MQHKSDRRILTSFVVQPCESASPAALLRALVQLCRTIRGYQFDILGPNKRIACEIIRQVGILLLFLEEIQDEDGVAALPGSVVLCFSELYVILQKLRCLLEDCTREGARVWMVMHSPQVASDFRPLIRSVATILDVLPLDSIKVSAEVRDFIELLRRQVWKVRIEVDPRDEVARKCVLSILDQFENGVPPDSSDLNWVLDHLEIRSWIDCNKEIKFLEEEIELENSKGEERDIVLLSSLLGFMNYCRGVMFDVVDGENSNKSKGRFEGEAINHLNLDDFRCPISLELMMDPVTVSTGHTYDRISIEKWLRAGNLTCPKTGGKLMNAELVPNSALHKIIQKFCCEKGISVEGTGSRKSRDSSWTHLAVNSPAAMGATRILSDFLVEKLSVGSEKERGKAAYEVRLLTKFSSFNRASLVEAGSILWLLNLLSCSDPLTQENSVAALLNLSKLPKGKTVIVETGGLGPILDVLRSGLKIESQQNAAAILFYLSSVDEYRQMIGEIPEAIPALVRLLKSGTNRGKKVTVVALFAILLFHKNLPRVINAGAVPSLIDLLSSERTDLVNDTLAVLAALAEKPEGASEILKASAIPLLMHILQSSPSKSGKKYCVSILLSLCINGGAEVVSTLRKMPLTMASLYSLLTDGTSRGSKKASSLLSLLHDWPIPNSILAQPVQQDWAVHVQ